MFGFVTHRVEKIADAATASVTLASQMANSSIYTAFNLVSLGQNQHFSKGARDSHVGVSNRMSHLIEKVIQIVNPGAKFKDWKMGDSEARKCKYRLPKERISLTDLSSGMASLALKQQKILDRLYGGNFLEKHLETRLFSLVSGTAFTATCVALTILGAASTVVAMCTFGCFEKINSFATNNIKAFGLAVNQLQLAVLGVIVPSHVVNPPQYIQYRQTSNENGRDNFVIPRLFSGAAAIVGAAGLVACALIAKRYIRA